MKPTWRTLWVQNDIVVYRDEVEVDRLPGDRIVRVHLVYRGRGDTPGDPGFRSRAVAQAAGADAFFELFLAACVLCDLVDLVDDLVDDDEVSPDILDDAIGAEAPAEGLDCANAPKLTAEAMTAAMRV